MASPSRSSNLDAIIVGSGPNGLAAAITLARAGKSVSVLEAADTIGGGARSAELTLPGCIHDVCSAIHPLAAASPCFRQWPLEKYGLQWIQPEIPVAHPLPGGRAAALRRSIDGTAEELGADGGAYRKLMEPFTRDWEKLAGEFLQPMIHLPRHPFLLLRFGMQAIRSARSLATGAFRGEPARALFAGLAAHSVLPLDAPASAAFGLVLGAMGHAVGWPMPGGGAQRISDALAAYLRELGGTIKTGTKVKTLHQLPRTPAVLLDVPPRAALEIAGHRMPPSYRKKLENFRHGPAIFKMDMVLREPIPWTASACRRAGTVHVIGTMAELENAAGMVAAGRHPERPFVLVAQPTLFDKQRAPEGKHIVWAYCHVPSRSTCDMSDRIEKQIERFAPGFRDLIIARHTMASADLERRNPNLIGGDISGGANNFGQLLARPVFGPAPYRTPWPGLYLCSSSTPPGGGVHGMCGYHAANAALRDLGKITAANRPSLES